MAVQITTWTEILHQESAFPMDMRRKLEDIVEKLNPVKDTRDTILPSNVIAKVQADLVSRLGNTLQKS